jgi:hydrogenase nickel incorporation protein HypA/HybF
VHEVSLMKNLLRTVEEVAAREGKGPVKIIHLKIGEMSGVNIDALSFAFEVLSKGTAAEGGRLDFERVALSARCKECGGEFHPEEFVFRCIRCGSPELEILRGREMEVDYILIDDEISEEETSGGSFEERG